MAAHEHYWLYPDGQIQGRTKNEVVVVRYCRCGAKQMASTRTWRKATGAYARAEHYGEKL